MRRLLPHRRFRRRHNHLIRGNSFFRRYSKNFLKSDIVTFQGVTRTRRILKWSGIVLLGFFALVLIALFTYRSWLGVALKPIAQRYGVTFEKYERLPNGRFLLSGLTRTNALFDFRISRIQGFAPDVWYRNAKKQGTNPPNYLEINGWKVVLHEKAGSSPGGSRTNLSVYEEFKRAEKYLAQLREWLPKATFLNGTVEYQNRDYTLPVVTWDQGKLDASGVWAVSAVPFELKGKLSGEMPYQLYYAMPPVDLRIRVQFWETNGFVNAKLNGGYKETTVTGNAEFGHEGLLPIRAKLNAPEFHVSPKPLKLPQYRDITGNFNATWNTNTYSLNLKSHADPLSSAVTNFPAADVELAASGDTNHIRIDRASSTAPGLKLSISAPVELTYKGEMLSERSEISLNVELEKLPWVKMAGHVEGRILLERGKPFPRAKIEASGANLSGYKMSVERLQLAGLLDWPALKSVDANFQFSTNAFIKLQGSGNLKTREIAEANVQVEGPVATNLLPAGCTYSNVKLNANLSGPLTNLSHAVQLQLRELETPQSARLNLDASWKGKMAVFDDFAFRAQAGPAVLSGGGHGSIENGRTNIVLRELKLTKGDELYLGLERPFQVVLSQRESKGAIPTIELEPLVWRGGERILDVSGVFEWPQRGKVDFAVTNINPELFQFFVKRSLSGVELSHLSCVAHWNEGPLLGKASGRFSLEQKPFGRFSTEVNMELADRGLVVSELSVNDEDGQIAHARGFLPVSVRPLDPAKVLHLSTNRNIEFQMETAQNEAFWNTLTNITHVKLTNAAVALDLHGTVQKPTGRIRFSAASVEYLKAKRELPSIGRVDATVLIDEEKLRIPGVSVRVEDQPILVTGQLSLGTNFWQERREEILKYAIENADVRLEATNLHVAPFVRFLPKYLAPSGNIKVDAGLKPGRELRGTIVIADIETRPLPKIGVIQGIGGQISLNRKKIDLQKLQAVIGGETMAIAGRVDISQTNLDRGYPATDLRITGKNLPLARNPDVILRSDLDLTVRNGTNWTPVIAGTATLRDSFLLRDIQALVPGRVTRPSRRPPYFSIEQEPIRNWGVNVRVRGDNFMRVRSPFFQAQVSTVMQVSGTMYEPFAIGEASITSGKIIFPFAPLDVKQALVSITPDDPYRPKVFAIATGRAFGFDIRMQAEGPADNPIIQFSSVPSLTSEQIVLMLTTGQIPRSDFGFSNQEKASKLAFFLGKSLLSKLNPGKPGEEKLVIRSGEDITEQGRQTYSVEYKLNDRWSLIGEYDRFGALNADVKWRLFSK